MDNNPATNPAPMAPTPAPKQSPWAIPVAIILAGALIGLAVYYSGKSSSTAATTADDGSGLTQAGQNVKIPPVTSADHIIGDINAPIKIVEYSDLQCPYCKEFDTTMRQVMQDYQGKGVAWVYRNYWAVRKLPDGSVFHPLGGQAIQAAECVAQLGGNDKYFDYIGKIFANQDTDSLTDPDKYAVAEGIDKTAFDKCYASNNYETQMAQEYADGNAAGVNGTPNAFIESKNGTIVVPGAVPYSDMKTALDAILKNQ